MAGKGLLVSRFLGIRGLVGWAPLLWAPLLWGLVTTGCGRRERPAKDAPHGPNLNARRFAALQSKAEADLGCTADIKYSYADGMHQMAGCGKQAAYVLYCPGGWQCAWLNSPVKEAAFTLNCPEAQLTVTQLDKAKFGVAGCDKRISYGVACIGTSCQWVADAASSQVPVAQPSGELSGTPTAAPASE
jgi:hypothetical protein